MRQDFFHRSAMGKVFSVLVPHFQFLAHLIFRSTSSCVADGAAAAFFLKISGFLPEIVGKCP